MKFQNCILINFVMTHGQAQSNMALQLFQSCGHKNNSFRSTSVKQIEFTLGVSSYNSLGLFYVETVCKGHQ